MSGECTCEPLAENLCSYCAFTFSLRPRTPAPPTLLHEFAERWLGQDCEHGQRHCGACLAHLIDERDAAWCKAVIHTGLSCEQISAVLAKFMEYRAEGPPDPEAQAALVDEFRRDLRSPPPMPTRPAKPQRIDKGGVPSGD